MCVLICITNDFTLADLVPSEFFLTQKHTRPGPGVDAPSKMIYALCAHNRIKVLKRQLLLMKSAKVTKVGT